MSRDGINPGLATLDKIRQWPKPEKGTRLASFLGLCNYYKDLIPSFAHISEPSIKSLGPTRSLGRRPSSPNWKNSSSSCSSPESCGYLISSAPSSSRLTAVALEKEQSSNSAATIRASTTQWASSREPSPARNATMLRITSNSTQWFAPSSTLECFCSAKISSCVPITRPSQSPLVRSAPDH